MGRARRVGVDFTFNGKNVKGIIDPFIESVTYQDIARDKSDSIDLTLQDVEGKWISDWYPRKGDNMEAAFEFTDWNKDGDSFSLTCGRFYIDDMSFSGNPRSAKISGVAIPAKKSFTTRERNKTWKKATIKKIATKIAQRYKLTLSYKAPNITVSNLEQSNQTDSAFLYKLCDSYNLGMKVYNDKLIIYDPGKMEQQEVACMLTPSSFIDGGWSFSDTLDGVYNGCRISFTPKANSSDTKSIYFGWVKESADNARTLKVSERANSKADAKYKACAAINKSNEQATTLSGEIWPDKRIVSGVTVEVRGFGIPDGKYFVDKVTTTYSGGGATVNVEMHKCQRRLRRV